MRQRFASKSVNNNSNPTRRQLVGAANKSASMCAEGRTTHAVDGLAMKKVVDVDRQGWNAEVQVTWCYKNTLTEMRSKR